MLKIDDVDGGVLGKILFKYVPRAGDDPFARVDAGETFPKNTAR